MTSDWKDIIDGEVESPHSSSLAYCIQKCILRRSEVYFFENKDVVYFD